MSLVAISGNASGTGTLTIAAPNTNSNYTLTLPTNTGTLISTASNGQVIPKAALPAGSVLQVVSTTKTDTFSSASSSFIDVTGFSVSITPSSSSSKILVFGYVTGSLGLQASITGYGQLVRNSTAIGNGADGLAHNNAADSSFTTQWSFNYLDSPATTSSTLFVAMLPHNFSLLT